MKSNHYIRIGSHNFMRAQFLLLLTFFSLAASAVTFTDPIYNVVYNLNETTKVATVAKENSSIHRNNASAIVIPQTLDIDGVEYRVNGILEGAFNYTAITSIDIQVRITELSGCFRDCKNLTEVNLPSSLRTIRDWVFCGCDKITSVNTENVVYIGAYAFADCTSLKCPNLENVTSIGQYAFRGCDLGDVEIRVGTKFSFNCFQNATITSLTFINNSDTPKEFGANLFKGVKGLEFVKFPGFLTQIPSFTGAPDLKTVDLSEFDGSLSVAADCFKDCTSLSTVIFPDNVVSIGANAFRGCAISDLKIPQVQSIGNYAFADSKVSKITWPTNEIAEIGTNIFGNSAVASVNFPSWMYRVPDALFSDCAALKSVEFHSGIKVIGDSAFTRSALESLTLPSGLTEIKANAFYQNQLSAISIPASVKAIGDSAFCRNNIGLITLNAGVESIGRRCFKQNKISSLSIPSSLKVIGEQAFYENEIATLTLNSGVEEIGDKAFFKNQLTDLDIPASVKSVGEAAFSNNLLTSATLPVAVTHESGAISFGKDVLKNNSISEFDFPAWMTTVPEGFLSTNQLTSVTFANGTDSIKADAFYGNTLLKIDEFPSTVKHYGKTCFYSGGSGLTGDDYLGTVHIGGGVEICDNAFEKARLKEIIFDDNDFTLGEKMFLNATSIRRIAFPADMTHIPAYICYGLPYLREVVWPDKIEEVGERAFTGCKQLNFTPTEEGYDAGGYKNVLDLTKWPFDNHGDETKSLKLGTNCFGETSIDHIVWPENNIGFELEGIFQACGYLNSVSIPAWMTEIPSQLFFHSSQLRTLTWDIDSWTDEVWAEKGGRENYHLTIGEKSFADTGISVIRWPDVPTSIQADAFSLNRRAASIEWPKSPATLDGGGIFQSCGALKEPTTVPSYITNIPGATFYNCPSLPEFTIPESVTSLGGAFQGGKALKTVRIEGDIQTLGRNLFMACTALEKVIITKPITFIGRYCFSGCTSLQEVEFHNGEEKIREIEGEAFASCRNLKEFPDILDSRATLGSRIFNNTDSLKHLTLPTYMKNWVSGAITNSSVQAVDFLPGAWLWMEGNEFNGTPLLGVSTLSTELERILPCLMADRGENKGILLVNRNMRGKFVEAEYNRLWDIVERKQPVIDLQGYIKSKFIPGETVNHYNAILSWEIAESDLNKLEPTEYELYRDGKIRAKIIIGTPETVEKVDETNLHLNETTTSYPVIVKSYDADGNETSSGKKGFAGDFVYETGENTFTMFYANQHTNLYFKPATSHRLGLNERMGAKSWFIFVDEFDSPELDGLNVPSSYSYTVKMKGYEYPEPRNNPGYKVGDDGKYWYYETLKLDDIVSEPCVVYTSMAVPSLTTTGTYSFEEIENDIEGTLPMISAIGDDGSVSVTYEFADKSHLLHTLDSKPIIDHITSYEINSVQRSGPTEWQTINIKGDTNLGEGEMIVPKEKEPGEGSSFQLVTHTLGRGDFGSRVVTIPGTPTLNIELEKTMIYGSEADHNHNTVIRNDIILTPDVRAMSYPSEIPPSTHHVIGVWRTVDRQEIVNEAPRRAGEESSDPSGSNEILIHHNGSDVVEHWWNCDACRAAQGYNATDESCVYTDHVVAEHSQASLNTNYRVRMYVQTPYDENQWMIAEAQAGREEVLTDIRNIGIDSDTPIYFNLQGMRVMQPRHGEILIRVDRTGSHRIRYAEE